MTPAASPIPAASKETSNIRKRAAGWTGTSVNPATLPLRSVKKLEDVLSASPDLGFANAQKREKYLAKRYIS